MNVISKEMVEKLYDPKETGVLVIPEKVSESDLIELRRFIKEKEDLFEIKRENTLPTINVSRYCIVDHLI